MVTPRLETTAEGDRSAVIEGGPRSSTEWDRSPGPPPRRRSRFPVVAPAAEAAAQPAVPVLQVWVYESR
eukprot:CAMPEP_0118935542 /NCGR_PEP_ID=MMETSP1169-20130426/15700_1 /TAXON_ID=36882 /ORGANISM="Pyramimonas obovata, Strain CCMP722" /LENGTH=68 /DNA_ID=CAMNT_0006878593 /DNA_START=208 /DNA_END=414 /DNA_ORIENTATION=+